MAKIKAIEAREVLNARGFSTIEATVVLNDGKIGITSCPIREQIGSNEAINLKNNDVNRLGNQDINKAIGNIKNVIAPLFIGKEAEHQPEIDKIMIDLDGTQDKSRLGANVMFAISMAVAKAAAESSCLPLFIYLRQFMKKDSEPLKIPTPIFNCINGKDSGSILAYFHEFLIIPASSKSYLECIRIGEEITKLLRKIIGTKYVMTADNDYGEGFTPNLNTNIEAFSLIKQAIEISSLKLGFDVFFGLNSKASIFFKDKKYNIKDNPKALSSKDMINYYVELNKSIHLLYLEDPLDKDDWGGWASIFEKMSDTTIIVGDDLIAMNPNKLRTAIDKKTVNAVIIKPNQIGTVTESLSIVQVAKEAGLKIVVCHRANETNDDYLSDFSVAVIADYIKIGSLLRGENIAKYNRLLQIDNQLKIL